MTDSQYLFAVLVFVYLLECVAWVHVQAFAFRWRRPGRGRWSTASHHLGNPDGGFVLKPLFPATGSFVVSRFLPLSVSPRGLFSFLADVPHRDARPRQNEIFVAWEDVIGIQRCGSVLYINGAEFVKLDSPRQAQWTVEALNRLRLGTDETLPQRIEDLFSAAFDVNAIERKLADFDRCLVPLRFCCSLLFFFFFLVAPLWVSRWGASGSWMAVVAGVVALDAAVIWQFFKAYRQCFPTRTDDFWVHVFSMMLNPVDAIRACDRISRDLLCGFHPLAVGFVVCPPASFESLARGILTDLRYPLLPVCPGADSKAQAAELWLRQRRLRLVESFLARIQMDPERLLKPEPAYDSTARSFCPRCHRHYEQPECSCEPCGGIPSLHWT